MSKEAFDEYVRLHKQLAELINQGKCDTDEADAIRDQMDRPWHKLSQEEEKLAREL